MGVVKRIGSHPYADNEEAPSTNPLHPQNAKAARRIVTTNIRSVSLVNMKQHVDTMTDSAPQAF
jgi:hypothetical protein